MELFFPILSVVGRGSSERVRFGAGTCADSVGIELIGEYSLIFFFTFPSLQSICGSKLSKIGISFNSRVDRISFFLNDLISSVILGGQIIAVVSNRCVGGRSRPLLVKLLYLDGDNSIVGENCRCLNGCWDESVGI